MYKEVAIMWKNKEMSVDYGGVFGLSIITHVTLQKIVAHDFIYKEFSINNHLNDESNIAPNKMFDALLKLQ